MSNSHIGKFALDYCFSEAPPQYAVLLKGPWGAGKTWFVKRLIDDVKAQDGHVLYVSLYGLDSFSAIEYEFYRQLHPILSSRGMEIAGKVLRGALRATLKVDFNGDGSGDGSVNVSIPEVRLPDYLKDTARFVMVFDDVERCSIKLPDLLGYINHFTEHQDYKVILVANEDVLEKYDGYKSIKEKLIGKTFEVTPQLDEALDRFFKDTGSEVFFESHRDLVKEVYVRSGFKNLRHLRQALLDFVRLEKQLPADVTDCHDLVAHLLRLFLILTFEVRHGDMKASEIKALRSGWLAHAKKSGKTASEKEEDKSLYTRIVERHPDFNCHDLLVDVDVWVGILDTGVIDIDEIASQLRNSKYLISSVTLDWVKLWNFRSHSDAEFDQLLGRVWARFEAGQCADLIEVKHVCGMMMFFSTKGLFAKSAPEVLHVAKACVDTLRKGGCMNHRPSCRPREDESALGMAFLGGEIGEFKELCDYAKEQARKAYYDTFPDIAVELMRLFRENPFEFSRKLFWSNSGLGEYYDVPVLVAIDPADFVSAFVQLKADDLYEVSRFFRERYRGRQSVDCLAEERGWIEAVKERLEKEVDCRSGTLLGYCLSEILSGSVDQALEAFGSGSA